MKTSKMQVVSILTVAGFFVVILAITILMAVKNTTELRNILTESVKSQLISTSVAAREIIDAGKFDSYNSIEDVHMDEDAYNETLKELRIICDKLGATYIYALKQLRGKYYFVFDTDPDPDVDTLFKEYEVSPVHEAAFLGRDAGGVLNVVDEFGSFNTGAVPIWKNNKVIGIICTDIEDKQVRKSKETARTNTVYLIVAVTASMCVMMTIVITLLRRVDKMQLKLYRMANFDVITGLPNRQHLMTYLDELSSKLKKTKSSYALLFIDIDNFKRVNDNAGHDAGDLLLRLIATYLTTIHTNSKSFRPPAGILNISARIGGDEFIQIVPDIATEEEADLLAKKMIDSFHSEALNRFIEKYDIGMSIGVALYPYHSDDYHVLLKYADTAMYQAKNKGKHAYRVFSF